MSEHQSDETSLVQLDDKTAASIYLELQDIFKGALQQLINR